MRPLNHKIYIFFILCVWDLKLYVQEIISNCNQCFETKKDRVSIKHYSNSFVNYINIEKIIILCSINTIGHHQK